MVIQTPNKITLPHQILGNSVGAKFRDSLRKLGVVHMYKREGKFYTFDIPFQLKISKGGDKIVVVVNKSSLPRTFPSPYLIEAKEHLEVSLGMPIQIYVEKDILALCCQVSKSAMLATVA
jgi:hypothetical protein